MLLENCSSISLISDYTAFVTSYRSAPQSENIIFHEYSIITEATFPEQNGINGSFPLISMTEAERQNMLMDESETGGPFPCGVCGRKFRDRFYVRRHMERHTGERPYRCSYCSQPFAYLKSLKRHKRKSCSLRPPQDGNSPRQKPRRSKRNVKAKAAAKLKKKGKKKKKKTQTTVGQDTPM